MKRRMTMETVERLSRRAYLKASAAVGAAFVLPRFAIGRAGPSANSKINVALIGAGGIAKTCYRDCREHNVVALAEVDEVRGAGGFEAFPRAKRYRDFRKLLDAHGKELDLVIVNTPDHTHFPATYMAMERGIAVHTQKPLTHNIWQARTLQKAYHKFGVHTVMGNQGHNFEGMRQIREWYEAGLIGEVREVHAWTNRTTTNTLNAKVTLPAEPIPDTLDWDLWTGPAKLNPYNSKLCPSGWRWWWDYGLGGLGDIGCHTLDIPSMPWDWDTRPWSTRTTRSTSSISTTTSPGRKPELPMCTSIPPQAISRPSQFTGMKVDTCPGCPTAWLSSMGSGRS